MNEPPNAQWPKKGENKTPAIEAFTAALTLAGRNSTFRKRLIQPDSAKIAVAEVGKIAIPDEEVIVFYENENAASQSPVPPFPLQKPLAAAAEGGPAIAERASDEWSNEHYHFFVLPPLKENGDDVWQYQQFQTGAYRVWWDNFPE